MIIKEIDPKDDAIQKLESLLEYDISKLQRKNIQTEISRLKKGITGEKQAAYHINQIFTKSFVAHDLRLDVDGEIAQIDHIAINKFGFVVLFETKNFSTDVKIDNDGVFHFYDYKRKDFRPFPSPIEQSKRHEKVIRKAFKKINFIPVEIEHLVVFDHKAKITKPKQGFDNVCYPDMIEKAHDKLADNMGALNTVIGLGNLAKRVIKTDSLSPKDALSKLVEEFHKPSEIDYRAKFQIETKQDTIVDNLPDDNQTVKTEPSSTNQYDMLTLAKAAKEIGIKTKEFEVLLIAKGLLFRNENDFLMLSEAGKEAGIRFRKGRAGFYFLIPVIVVKLFKK